VAVAAAFVVALFASSAVMFVWPSQDRVTGADAVVVLAGSHNRLDEALRLMRRHIAPVLVISDGRAKEWLLANRLCAGPAAFKVICFRSNPYSTRGEAEELRRLTARNHWRTVVVVTSTYHVTRARILLRRCLTGRVEVVGVPFSWTKLPVLLASEWSKLIYALTVAREC
jgi:uncharacterized SAM-binding protein YcdF (DUF218 family)